VVLFIIIVKYILQDFQILLILRTVHHRLPQEISGSCIRNITGQIIDNPVVPTCLVCLFCMEDIMIPYIITLQSVIFRIMTVPCDNIPDILQRQRLDRRPVHIDDHLHHLPLNQAVPVHDPELLHFFRQCPAALQGVRAVIMRPHRELQKLLTMTLQAMADCEDEIKAEMDAEA